jgi:hypothetical protein
MRTFLLPLALVLLILSGCYQFNNPVDPKAADYQGYESGAPPADCMYRRSITVTNSTGALNAYQVGIGLSTAEMGTPYTHINTDGSDLRFTDAGDNELSYWIESWNPNGQSLVWVKTDLQTGDNQLYLYYGNPSAQSASSGADTFLFFDDFEEHSPGDIADGWLPAYQVVEDGGLMVIDDGTGPGEPVIAQAGNWVNAIARSKFRFVTISGGSDYGGIYVSYQDWDHFACGCATTPTLAQLFEENGSGFVQIGSDGAMPDLGTSWHVQELQRYGNEVSFLIDDVLYVTATTTAPTSGTTGFWSQNNNRGYRDWHLVRKGAASEPTVTVGGQEEL